LEEKQKSPNFAEMEREKKNREERREKPNKERDVWGRLRENEPSRAKRGKLVEKGIGKR